MYIFFFIYGRLRNDLDLDFFYKVVVLKKISNEFWKKKYQE